MSITTILVHVETDANARSRLEFAAAMARDHDASLIGFAGAGVQPVITGDGMYPIDGVYWQQMREEVEAALHGAKELFLSVAGGDLDASWRQDLAGPGVGLARAAAAADLVVSGTPQGASVSDVFRRADPGSLVLSTGRPVLFAAEGAVYRRPKIAVVAWKDTIEARRAVSAALPCLRPAERVLVAAVGTDDPDSLSDVVRLLMRHGVRAEAKAVGEADAPEEELVELALREGADLIVSGAYGHSRLREWAFGGFTRTLLDDDRLNRLMMG